jgi:hypothetical protein
MIEAKQTSTYRRLCCVFVVRVEPMEISRFLVPEDFHPTTDDVYEMNPAVSRNRVDLTCP